MKRLIFAISFVVCCAGAAVVVGQESAESLLKAGRLRDAVARPLRVMTDSTASASERRIAAGRLLDESNRDAERALEAVLAPQSPDYAWRAMVEAIALHPDTPDDEAWPPIMLRYSLATTKEDLDLFADALGRFDDNKLERRIRETAQDPAEALAERVRMIRLLGYHRDQKTAERLMELTATDQPKPVQDAAYEALAHLSGLYDYHRDRRAWGAWWEEARRLSDEDWLRHLLANQARRAAAIRIRMTEGEHRLLESQRALYRTTGNINRPAVLAYMLRDPLPPIRQLGIDLALQRLLDDQPFEEALRSALRECLVDPLPNLRSRGALLLRDLLDEPAARISADRLANDEEHDVDVQRAYLLLVSRIPQRSVVTPALEMLNDATLRAEAAGALAAAYDADLLDDNQIKQAQRLARRGLPKRGLPAAKIVMLLGKVGDDEDFGRIANWVDADNAAVKQAASLAWAGSDRSLKLLADRAGDPVIRPIVIGAAERRGVDPQTLRALAVQRPNQPEAIEAWRRALIAMAGRVDATHVLWVANELDSQGESLATLEQLLTAALPHNHREGSADVEMTEARLQLLLMRADVRVRANSAQSAINDYQQLETYLDDLSSADVERYRRGHITALIEVREYDEAFAEARRLLGPGSSASTNDRVVDQFIETSRRLVDQRQPEAAQAVLDKLMLLLGPSIKPEVAQRITVLEAEINRAPRIGTDDQPAQNGG